MKKRLYILFFLLMLVSLTACDNGGSEEGQGIYQVYYVDSDSTGLVQEEYRVKDSSKDTVKIIQELLNQLQTGSAKGIYRNPIDAETEISNLQIKETQLSVHFSAAYNAKIGIDEILARAAIVKTLCQVDGVEYVEFYVEDQPLMLGSNAVGLMNEDSFIDSLENNTTQKKQVTLYFADESGEMAAGVTADITYNSAEPLEKLLLEKLIAGPEPIGDLKNSGVIPSVPPDTKLNRVTIRDNICYVDLSREFNELLKNVKSDVVVYSIVNTLCELPNVNKVQFAIEGEQQEKYGETEEFNTPFERNLNIAGEGEQSGNIVEINEGGTE